jgi:hypothetical protein
MARATGKKSAAAKFPHRVDAPIPSSGLVRQLTDMLDWCRFHVAADAWAEHGHSERRKGEASLFLARFYFMNEADAEAFKKRWVTP